MNCMKPQRNLSTCPIVGAQIGPDCKVTGCMHNRSGSCCFVEALPLEGDVTATSQIYAVPVDEVQSRVIEIQLALVASSWFEHINQKPITDGRECDFRAAQDPRQGAEFTRWNTSSFSFGQVLSSLQLINTRL